MPSPEDINYQQPFAGYDDPTLPQRPYQEFANPTQYQPFSPAMEVVTAMGLITVGESAHQPRRITKLENTVR